MTRKQAFLILLLALLALAGRQHIQWPSRFWESPSFQAVDWQVLLEGLSTARENNETSSLTVAPKATPVSEETPAEVKKPAEEPKKVEEKPKAPKQAPGPQKKAAAKAAAPPPTSATPEPAPEPRLLKVPLEKFPYEVVARISSCWTFAERSHTQNGVIGVQFTHDENGYPKDVRMTKNTLGIPMVSECVTRTIGSGEIRFEQFDPESAGKTKYETTIVFEHGEEPT